MARHYCWNPKLRRYTVCRTSSHGYQRDRERQDTPVGIILKKPYFGTRRTASTTARSTTRFKGSRYQHVPKARTFRTVPRGVPDYPTWPLRQGPTRPGRVWRTPYRFPIWR